MRRSSELLKDLDPVRDITDWPSTPQIDWAAMQGGPALDGAGRRTAQLGRRWRRRAALGAVAVGVAACVTGAVIVQVTGAPASVFAATPPPLRLQYDTGAPAARDTLLRLAASVEKQAEPAPPRSGPVSFVQVAQWSLDFSSGESGTTAAILPQVISVWRAADGSGKRATVTLGPSDLDELPDAPTLLAVATRRTPTAETYAAGQLAFSLTEPTPGNLAQVLYGHQPLEDPAVSTARGIADLYRWAAVDRDVRVAALRLLARTDKVLLRGTVTDRLGREGIAVSVDSQDHGTRDLLIFDQHTGWLLAYESIFLRKPEKLPVQVPAVFSYVLYLAQDRRPDTNG